MIGLLWVLAAVEVTIVVVLFGGMLGHAAWLRRRHGRDVVVQAARDHVARAARGGIGQDDLAGLAPLDVGERLSVLAELAGAIGGEGRDRLRELADGLGLLGIAAQRCRSRSWRRRLAGVRWFIALGGGDAAVPRLLDDPHPEVRAEAVRWVAEHANPTYVEAVVATLDDPSRWCRLAAATTVVRLGDVAVPALRDHLAAQSGRLTDALDAATWIADPRLREVALELAGHPRPAVRTRAIGLLGSVGGAEAILALQAALAAAEPEVRVAAARGLGRLGRWEDGSLLDAVLDDPDWEVRRAAGLALRELGAPGLVLLRRCANSSRTPGSTLARQVLEVRSVTRVGDGWESP